MDNIQAAVRPITILSKILGLIPIHSSEDSQLLSEEIICLDYLYGPVLIVGVLTGYIAQFIFFENRIVFQIFIFFQEHAAIIFVLFVLLVMQLKRKPLLEAMELFQEVDMKFKLWKTDLQYLLIHKIAKFIVILYLVILFFCQIPIRFFFTFYTGETAFTESDTAFALNCLLYYLSVIEYAVTSAMRYQFICYMAVLRIRFRTVNKEINKVAKITEVENKHCLEDSTIVSETPTNSSKKQRRSNKIENLKIFSIATNQFENNNLPNMPMSNDVPKFNITKTSSWVPKKVPSKVVSEENSKHYLKIRCMADIHDKLCLCLYTVNSIFSLQLLFLVGIEFVLITATLYNEYDKIDSGFVDLMDIMKFLADFFWNLLRCGETLLVIWICSNTCYHANRTSLYIHKVIYMVESKLKREIENFSMQLLHNKVEVTAGGFFPIDFTLLYTIVGAVTTYLVILVQFHLADKATKEKAAAASVTS